MPSISGLHSIPAGKPANGNLPLVVPASASEVQRLLGDVDPMILARVLATNASADEISEALRFAESEGERLASTSPRVDAVRAILDENSVFEDDILDEDYDFGENDNY